MKRVKIAELKDNLSRYLHHVRRGEQVLVLDRDEPIARIVPLRGGDRRIERSRDRLARLEHRGLLRRGVGGLPAWFGRRKPPKLRGSVLGDLLREREGGW